jgi:hypothetical protein
MTEGGQARAQAGLQAERIGTYSAGLAIFTIQ